MSKMTKEDVQIVDNGNGTYSVFAPVTWSLFGFMRPGKRARRMGDIKYDPIQKEYYYQPVSELSWLGYELITAIELKLCELNET